MNKEFGKTSNFKKLQTALIRESKSHIIKLTKVVT